jgi:hypothetical protein
LRRSGGTCGRCQRGQALAGVSALRGVPDGSRVVGCGLARDNKYLDKREPPVRGAKLLAERHRVSTRVTFADGHDNLFEHSRSVLASGVIRRHPNCVIAPSPPNHPKYVTTLHPSEHHAPPGDSQT